MYLIQGDPGAGKTTLALQFLLEGVRRGESVLYITLAETKRELVKVADSHHWSIDDIPLIDVSVVESLLRPEAQTTVFHPAEVELNQVTELILHEVRRIKPVRVVFDSLSEFRLMADTSLRYRRQLLSFKQDFARQGATVLLLDDRMQAGDTRSDQHVLSLAHGVIDLEQVANDYGTARRRLRVSKLRGVGFREGFHDYTIATGGLRVFPRLVAAEHVRDFSHNPVRSGIPELDDLLGGGPDRGTTTLIMGPSGSGKSTLAMQYAAQMASAGDRGMIFAFDEVRPIMLARARTLGIDLDRHVESGVITAEQVNPAELSPGEFAVRIRRGVEAGCRLVVIDSLNGYLNAMPGERFLQAQLHEVCAYLNQQGVLTILVLAQHGLLNVAESSLDISYLADTVITLRFFEANGEVKQALAVMKKRSGAHERTIREFKLDEGRGIRIGTPLKDFQGVLTGVPTFVGASSDILTNASPKN
jgi:circadian clock protein KaiC